MIWRGFPCTLRRRRSPAKPRNLSLLGNACANTSSTSFLCACPCSAQNACRLEFSLAQRSLWHLPCKHLPELTKVVQVCTKIKTGKTYCSVPVKHDTDLLIPHRHPQPAYAGAAFW